MTQFSTPAPHREAALDTESESLHRFKDADQSKISNLDDHIQTLQSKYSTLKARYLRIKARPLIPGPRGVPGVDGPRGFTGK